MTEYRLNIGQDDDDKLWWYELTDNDGYEFVSGEGYEAKAIAIEAFAIAVLDLR